MSTQRDATRLQLEGWAFGYPALTPGVEDLIFIDGGSALELHDLAARAGTEQAYQVFRFGARIAMQPWTAEHEQALRQAFDDILANIADRISQLPDLEDAVIEYCYDRLARRQTNRHRAAEFASRVLGYEINAEAWRKRVDRWAKERGLPKIDLPAGRPKTKNMDK